MKSPCMMLYCNTKRVNFEGVQVSDCGDSTDASIDQGLNITTLKVSIKLQKGASEAMTGVKGINLQSNNLFYMQLPPCVVLLFPAYGLFSLRSYQI